MTAIQFFGGLAALACALSLAMTLAWIVEQRTQNSGWIDTVWTFGLGSIGIASALIPLPGEASTSARQWLVAGAMLLWSLRLGGHIAQRSTERKDDPRYAKLREGYGTQARWQMFLLAQKQAIVSIPMALAIWIAAHQPAPTLRAQDFAAMLVLAIAIGGEALADRQLRAFRRSHHEHGTICNVGLWSWSRHPNYFFEWFGWLAYPLIAIDLDGGYPSGWFALGAPVCMYWLLVYVSGIPPLEEHMLKTRGDAFRAYQARTSAFFPLAPRRIPEREPS